MRAFHAIAATAVLSLVTGCATSAVMEKARPIKPWDEIAGKERGTAAHPGYYALLPLTVPVDVATSPFQFAFALFVAGTMHGWR